MADELTQCSVCDGTDNPEDCGACGGTGQVSAPSTRTMTAVFPRQSMAEAFYKRLAGDCPSSWSLVFGSLARKGRTVTWDTDRPSGEYDLDLAETVGYYGSPPQGPVATLNGNRTPRSY